MYVFLELGIAVHIYAQCNEQMLNEFIKYTMICGVEIYQFSYCEFEKSQVTISKFFG